MSPKADFVAGDDADGAPPKSDFCTAGATAAAGSFGFKLNAPPGDPEAAAAGLSPNLSVIGPPSGASGVLSDVAARFAAALTNPLNPPVPNPPVAGPSAFSAPSVPPI